MAIAFNNAAYVGSGSNGFSGAYISGAGTNRLLLAFILGNLAGGGADSITAVTYGGQALALGAQVLASSGGGRNTYVYWQIAPLTGSNSLAVTAAGSSFIMVCAADYTGVGQTGQPDNSVTHDSVSNTATITTPITTIADNCWVIDYCSMTGASGPPVAGAGGVLRLTDVFNSSGIFDSNGMVHPPGSYSVTNTAHNDANNPMMQVLMSFSPAPIALIIDYTAFLESQKSLISDI